MFFAALVASLALAIGLAIYDLTFRQLSLSGITAQSQYAIYAADTGAECALYWDTKYGCQADGTGCKSAFATSSTAVNAGTIACAGVSAISISGGALVANATAATTTFTISTINSGGLGFNLGTLTPCVTVVVAKTAVSGAPGVSRTSISSRGKNTCTGANQLERALQVNY